MNFKWDLTELFENEDAFYQEIMNIKELLSEIKIYEDKDWDEDILYEVLNQKWDIKERANNVLIYGSLRYYKDVTSELCTKLKSTSEKLNHEVDAYLNFIDQKIIELGKLKVHSFLRKNSQLEVYRHSLENLFRRQEHVLEDDMKEKTQENLDHINTCLSSYNNELRDMNFGEIDIDGKKMEVTSSNFGKFLASRDRETRKQTYFIVNQAFQDKKEIFSDLLDSIFECRIQNATLEHYPSVLEKVLFEENIDCKIIDTLIEAVHKNLHLIQRYLKIKSEFLQINNPHLYDFGVPLDHHLKFKYTFEEAVQIIKEALKPLGEEYLKVVDDLLDGHMDIEPDDHKHQSIIFSWHTYSFMNFRGSYIDLKNMIHELGHIVNYSLSKGNVPFIYEDSTIFVGETASIVNEILLNRYLYQTAGSIEEKIFYLSKEIENYFTSVFKQTMYTEFENELYHTKESNPLTSEKISMLYDKLIKKYYGSDILYDEISAMEWMRLGHIYRWSYYPYKYATGLINASVVVNSLVDEQSLSKEKYLEFLSAGSSLYSLDLLKMLQIDCTDADIINHGFRVLADDIEKLEHILSLKK